MSSSRPDMALGRGRPSKAAVAMLVLVACLFAGCGQPKGVLFRPEAHGLVWPQPPAPARVEYIGQLATSDDLKPARSFGEELGEALFGRKAGRSMLTPYAVCTDGGDRVFVCDSNAQCVHVFDLDRREYEQWRPPEATGGFSQPVGIVYDTRDRLLVADSVAGVLFAFDGNGQYLGELAREPLLRPCGLAVDPRAGRIFVADTGAHQVVVLAIDGEERTRIGRRGTALGEFNFPTNVAVDSAGRLFVSDTLNFRIQVFDHDLNAVRQIGEKGDMPGYFSHPKGLALDSDDHLYVVDAHFESVQIFDREGRLLLAFGEEGHGPGQFWLPTGIAISGDDRVWIADSYNRRVQVFQYLAEIEP
ncbi:MAG: SMP-30/gluconolactonase/LRE family protein [Planctomycetota bacterium]|nr:SMP-30/gluconolactonase/LRE family protein [Planctomycetota bacterium]